MGNLQTDWQGLIFTACLAQGIYTDCWAHEIITDCLKQGQHGTEDNYRPIGNKGYIQSVGQGTVKYSVAKEILRTVLKTRKT
jgi:hypothetical protein